LILAPGAVPKYQKKIPYKGVRKILLEAPNLILEATESIWKLITEKY